MPDKLSSPHRRNLAATCRRVEQSMIELEELIQEKGTPAITRQITRTYSAAQRAALLAAVQDVRHINESLFKRLHLKAASTDESQMVNAKFSQLWTILIDSRPNALKGGGDIPADEAQAIESHVDQMIARMNTALG